MLKIAIKIFLTIFLILGIVIYYFLFSDYSISSEVIVDYSPRYYELLNKGTLTEDEYIELRLEQEKLEKAYEEKTGKPYPFNDPDQYIVE